MGFHDAQWAYTLKQPLKLTAVLAALALHTDDKTHETFVGQQKLAAELGSDVKTVQRAVAALESIGIITRTRRRGENGFRTTDLIALNVQTYRAESQETESQETNSRQTIRPDSGDNSSSIEGQIVGAIEDHPEVIQDHPVLSRRKRSSPIPDDWTPNDDHRAVVLSKTGISLSAEAQKFRDHALANDRRLVDWDAGFRNWLRNARPGKSTPMERMQATLALAGPEPFREISPRMTTYRPDDGHVHIYDEFDNCSRCGARRGAAA